MTCIKDETVALTFTLHSVFCYISLGIFFIVVFFPVAFDMLGSYVFCLNTSKRYSWSLWKVACYFSWVAYVLSHRQSSYVVMTFLPPPPHPLPLPMGGWLRVCWIHFSCCEDCHIVCLHIFLPQNASHLVNPSWSITKDWFWLFVWCINCWKWTAHEWFEKHKVPRPFSCSLFCFLQPSCLHVM